MTPASSISPIGAPVARAAAVALLVLFVAYRWWARLEPLNSDDLRLIQFTESFLAGEHWLRGAAPAISPGHAQLRVGILPFLAPAVALLGPGVAYYVVPLVFSVLGFVATWILMHRHVDPRLAFLFALFHVFHPFELQHASLLLVDLPAAACLVVAILMLGEHSVRPQAGLLWAVGSGLFAVEAYLLRANSLLLFAPVVLVFVTRRRERLAAFVAAAVLVLGVVAEQFLLIARGLGFGYRWQAVTEAVDAFGDFLPDYAPPEFLTRQVVFLWSWFGRGVNGVLAVALLLIAMMALTAMLFVGRPLAVKAVAASGLAAWFLFAFGFSSWSAGRIHALAPPNFRYFQPFFYAAVVALCWLCHRLGARQPPARAGDQVLPTRSWRRTMSFVLAGLLVLTAARLSTVHLGKRLAAPDGWIARQLSVLDTAAAAESGRLQVAATRSSARLLALFRSESTKPTVSWQLSRLPALSRTASRSDMALLINRPRLEADLRYGSAERRERLASILADLQRELCSRRTPLLASRGVAIYPRKRPTPPDRRTLLEASPRFLDAENGDIRGWSLSSPVGIESSGAGGVILRPEERTSDWALSTGPGVDLGALPIPSPHSRLAGDESYALRICLGEMTGVRASAFLVQYDEDRSLETMRQPLWEGDNLLEFRAPAAAQTFRVVIEFRAIGGEGGVAAVLHRIELLPRSALELSPVRDRRD